MAFVLQPVVKGNHEDEKPTGKWHTTASLLIMGYSQGKLTYAMGLHFAIFTKILWVLHRTSTK